MKKFAALLASGFLLLTMTGVANADVTTYSDRSSFTAQGSIAVISNFQDYGGVTKDPAGYSFPGDPFDRGDVRYTSLQNMIIGPGDAGYTTTEPLIANSYWSPLTGDIATAPHQYTMFGFDIAQYNAEGHSSSPITITVYTNAYDYTYSGLTVPSTSGGTLAFKGYIASSGEYFTGFKITADNGDYGNAPGITNVTLGSPAPEPSTYALLGIGGLLVALRFRKSGVGSATSV